MMCYKDKTFCSFSDCKHCHTCDSAYTGEHQSKAEKWWGGKGAPVMFYVNKPFCYENNKKEEVN